MASTAALYTGEVLALAANLADFPITEAMNVHGSARSATCGSTVDLGLTLDTEGGIARVGIKAHACAIGQAAAALFARSASGRRQEDIAAARTAIEAWLGGGATLPNWPGFEAIAAARDYPARHGAILLAWRAAIAAFASGDTPG